MWHCLGNESAHTKPDSLDFEQCCVMQLNRRSIMDAKLCTLYSQVLEIEISDLDEDTNFFEAGGDSVTALRLVAAAQEVDVLLDIEDVFDYPELGELVHKCRHFDGSSERKTTATHVAVLDQDTLGACAAACQVERDTIEDIFPASSFQAAVLGLGKAYGTYMLQWVFQVCGQLDRVHLIEAWDRLQKKHQILRTRLVKIDDSVLQVVLQSDMEWQESEDLAQYKGKSLSQPVESGQPLFRYAIITEGDASCFVWTAQHSGFDATTRRLFFEHLQESLSEPLEYAQKENGSSYKDPISWTQTRPESQSNRFWESYLTGFKPFGWFFPLSLGSVPTTTSTLVRSWARGSANKPKFTMAVISHAAWAIALGNVSGLHDVHFTTARSGRHVPIPGAQSICGPMLVLSPVRTKLEKEQSLVDLLRSMQRQLASMAQHERDGTEVAARLVGGPQVRQSYLSWHPRGDDVLSKDLAYKSLGGPTSKLKPRRDLSTSFTANFGIALEIYEQASCLDFYIKWDDRLRSQSDVEQLVANFVHNLDQLVGSSDLVVGDLWPRKGRQWVY